MAPVHIKSKIHTSCVNVQASSILFLLFSSEGSGGNSDCEMQQASSGYSPEAARLFYHLTKKGATLQCCIKAFLSLLLYTNI